MTRLEANKTILNLLSILVEKHPDQRFEQLLCNYLGSINFYNESVNTLELLKTELHLE